MVTPQLLVLKHVQLQYVHLLLINIGLTVRQFSILVF